MAKIALTVTVERDSIGEEVLSMAKINKNELTKEQIAKAMACKTADELVKAAKEEGFELTPEEAEAYMAEYSDGELDDEMLAKVSGGAKYCANKKCKFASPCPRFCAIAAP